MTALAVDRALGTVPAHWSRLRFKAALMRSDERNTSLNHQMMSLTSAGLVVPRSDSGDRQKPSEESLPRYFVARPDDLVVNPMWLIGGAIGVSRVSGAVSPDYRVFRIREHHPRYVHHLLRSRPYMEQYRLFARAETTFDRRIQQGDLDNMVLPVPPVDEQRAIAEHLDAETAKIDTLIGKERELIEALRERRHALVVSSAKAGTASDDLVESGVAWLGPVPRSWEVDKLVRRARIGNGSTPQRENLAYWACGEVPWLNSSVVNQDRVTEAEQFVTQAALAECHLPTVPPGSVLVGLTGQGKTRGMATLLETPSTINQHIAYVTPSKRHWESRYLTWLLRAAYSELRRISEENGSTKGGLTCGDLGSLRVPNPPLDEQNRIARYLDEQTAKIDGLIAKTERCIDLAQERRSALITAAVTGQIDVRTAREGVA